MSKRSPAERRRLLTRLGIAAFAIFVLVIVPGYFSGRPQFFSKVPSAAEKYEPWSRSSHVKAGCQGCHVEPGFFPQAAYRVRMLGEFYVSLVARDRVPTVFATPTNAACLSCHDDLRSVSPKGDLRIPHKAHVNVLKMRCVTCHNYLVHELSPEGKHTPPMSGCLKCHDGDTAKNDCTACHTEKATPASHKTVDWDVVHPDQADESCNKCHAWTEKWCSDCHAKRPKSHTADWRAKHGAAVKEHRNCEACHTAAFCEKCHGEVPRDNFDPTLKLVQ